MAYKYHLRLVMVAVMASIGQATILSVNSHIKEVFNLYNMYSACMGPEFAVNYANSIQQATIYCQHQKVPEYVLKELTQKFKDNEIEEDQAYDSKTFTALDKSIKSKRSSLENKVGNLSCVLEQVKTFTPEGEINMELFGYDGVKEFFKGTLIGEDEVILRTLTEGYADCLKIANNWPQSELDRNPMAKAFGRRHVFLVCHQKLEDDLCYKKQIYEALKNFEELDTAEVGFGLPGNKYDIALGVWDVMRNTASNEVKAINDFFFTRPN